MEIKKMPKKQIYKNNYNETITPSQININHENNITRTNDNGINSAFLEINGNKKNAKYICKPCNFICNKNANYQSHLLTNKHYKNTNECCNVITNKCNNCDKEFSTLSGLWKHRKTCSIEHEVPSETHPLIQGTKLTVGSSDIPIELILEVIKQSKEVQNVLIEQNKELQKQLLEHSNKLLENENRLLEKDNQLIEQNKQILEIAKKPNMVNSNNNNKTSFNLQFFLNETCKDAMNIVDFVNSLQLTNNDFETTSREPTVPSDAPSLCNK
jgi:hypothetical protein